LIFASGLYPQLVCLVKRLKCQLQGAGKTQPRVEPQTYQHRTHLQQASD